MFCLWGTKPGSRMARMEEEDEEITQRAAASSNENQDNGPWHEEATRWFKAPRVPSRDLELDLSLSLPPFTAAPGNRCEKSTEEHFSQRFPEADVKGGKLRDRWDCLVPDCQRGGWTASEVAHIAAIQVYFGGVQAPRHGAPSAGLASVRPGPPRG